MWRIFTWAVEGDLGWRLRRLTASFLAVLALLSVYGDIHLFEWVIAEWTQWRIAEAMDELRPLLEEFTEPPSSLR